MGSIIKLWKEEKAFRSYLTESSNDFFHAPLPSTARQPKQTANLQFTHKSDASKPEEEGLYTCYPCNRSFTSGSKLSNHEKSKVHQKKASKSSSVGEAVWKYLPSVRANIASFARPMPVSSPMLDKLRKATSKVKKTKQSSNSSQ